MHDFSNEIRSVLNDRMRELTSSQSWYVIAIRDQIDYKSGTALITNHAAMASKFNAILECAVVITSPRNLILDDVICNRIHE